MCFELKLGCFEDSLNLSKILEGSWKKQNPLTLKLSETKVFEMVNSSFQNLLRQLYVVGHLGQFWRKLEDPSWFHLTQYLSDSYKKWLLNISPWLLFYLWKVQVLLKLSKKVSHFPSCQYKNSKLILQILHKKRCNSLNIHEAAPPHKNKHFSRKLCHKSLAKILASYHWYFLIYGQICKFSRCRNMEKLQKQGVLKLVLCLPQQYVHGFDFIYG